MSQAQGYFLATGSMGLRAQPSPDPGPAQLCSCGHWTSTSHHKQSKSDAVVFKLFDSGISSSKKSLGCFKDKSSYLNEHERQRPSHQAPPLST